METPNQKAFSRMVDAYLAGTATEEEKAILEKYYDSFADEPDVLDSMSDSAIKSAGDRMKANIDYTIETEERASKWRPWKYAGIAASFLLIAAAGGYFYLSPDQKPLNQNQAQVINAIVPGSNKAVLTLSNGSQIALNGSKNGKLANEDGTTVMKSAEGQLVYNQGDNASTTTAYNSVATPKGGQYQVNLPDGTKVWLNAASSLKYPVNFSGNERRVELSGEAYFEVAKNKTKPFRVVTAEQQVEVLGTHFDINAYSDELSTKTSLMEGSVRVKQINSQANTLLVPGQQAILKNGNDQFKLKNIDLDEAIAWKNGYFMFDEEPLPSILRKVARWYDVDIKYKGMSPDTKLSFSGTLSRYSNVSKVIRKLELTESVHFTIEGRTIIVSPYTAQ